MAHMVSTAPIIEKLLKCCEVLQFKFPFIMLICYWCQTEGEKQWKTNCKITFLFAQAAFWCGVSHTHTLTHACCLVSYTVCGTTLPSFNLLKDAAENLTTETHRFVSSVIFVCILPPCGEVAFFSWSLPLYVGLSQLHAGNDGITLKILMLQPVAQQQLLLISSFSMKLKFKSCI